MQIAAAFFGTIAFSLLFSVPKRFYLFCGLIGAAGWALYCVLTDLAMLTPTEATFFAALLVVLLSRCCAVLKKCPVTVFLVSGIFPLVPGAGIYWTAYYLVVGDTAAAGAAGFAALKAALAIVLGIVLILELPNKMFHICIRNKNTVR